MSITSKVYIVNGYHPEPILGAPDAENLGFITFNSDGRDKEISGSTIDSETSGSVKTLKQVLTTPTAKQKTKANIEKVNFL